MTPREKRLLRLVQLRERQHDVAALHLRAARGQLAVAEAAVNDAQEHTRAAQLRRLAAATDIDADEWLLACADVAMGTLIAANHHAATARAATMVQQAAEVEATARRERRQMEATLETLQRECGQQAARAEQGTLDEIARLQRATTDARGSWRRGF